MTKAALVVLAGMELREGLGRVVNALVTAKELQARGDEAVLVFDGAATQWIPALADESHRYHALFQQARPAIRGACDYCAQAYGVRDQVEAADIPLLDEYERHPSLRSLLADGYQIVTF
jgi:hypothetical protein